jgi:hypothetical protein
MCMKVLHINASDYQPKLPTCKFYFDHRRDSFPIICEVVCGDGGHKESLSVAGTEL